jgi:hypothetical protein
MIVSVKFWHVFGLSVESVENQPVYGYRSDDPMHEDIYFFDGFIINIPFIKIMIGEIFGLIED